MDGRAFKVGKENKKAEAKKVLLWMLLMVFAVLIVVLIVYMSYNRYMPSFLGWFKEEEDVVVEPVEGEIRIEQNVIDAFVQLEKTISGALGEDKPVEIILDIKQIESKLKDDNGKQFSLAFEGQKIKLIDKGIEGSISDQTVMEFAITTDEGIWVKADFSEIDQDDPNYKGIVYLKNYEKHDTYNCYNTIPITMSYDKDPFNTNNFETKESDDSIKTRIYPLQKCTSNAPLEQIKTAIDNFIDCNGPARLFIDIIKYKEEFGIPILMNYQDQKIEITNSLRRSNDENPIYSSELNLGEDTKISDDNTHEMIVEFNKNPEGGIKLIIHNYGEEMFFNYQNCFVETSIDTTPDGDRDDYEYGFIQFRNKVEGYYSIDLLEKCLLKEQVLKDIRDIKKQVIDITEFMTFFKLYRNPDTKEIYVQDDEYNVNTLIKTDSLQTITKDCTNTEIVDSRPIEDGNILIKEFNDAGGFDFIIADSKLHYKICKEDYVTLRNLLSSDEELLITKLISKRDDTDRKWYLYDGDELIKQLVISTTEGSEINSLTINPLLSSIIKTNNFYDPDKYLAGQAKGLVGRFKTESALIEKMELIPYYSTPAFKFNNQNNFLTLGEYIIVKIKHNDKFTAIITNVKYEDRVEVITTMTLDNGQLYEIIKNVQDNMDSIINEGAP